MRLIPLTRGQFAKVDDEDYEQLIGFRWFARWNDKTRSFYAFRKYTAAGRRFNIDMSRQVLHLQHKDGKMADHRNHDTLDNRRENLRLATRTQNGGNMRLMRSNKARQKGVSFHHQKWRARIVEDGKLRFLGYFPTKELAADAYRIAAERVFGEFACTG